MSSANLFCPGQRWISDSEPDLGLGVVIAVDFRTVTLSFDACGERRQYAKAGAPLTRLALRAGDKFEIDVPGTGARSVEIVAAQNMPDGLIIYTIRLPDGQQSPLPESLLPASLSMNRPLDRLLSGQFDSNTWFYLKDQTLSLLGKAQATGLMGLSSARAELVPHQLFIADEVARRYVPRVMLADEVGLGKTIEAGLIIQHQLVSGLSSRVLIVVPEPLLHQWLVEMLRRFNLQFTLLDKDRCQALSESGEVNPFASAQLVLSPLSLFSDSSNWLSAAETAGWDLCVVDEAHHVELGETEHHAPQSILPEQAGSYGALVRIAAASRGLLLLTATPEQLGTLNYFALLKLLDPARFNSYPDFLQEQTGYQAVAARARELPEDSPELRELLDQHGTGRILFRNTRRVLQGFPERQLRAWPLSNDSHDHNDEDATRLEQDPRVQWLTEWLTGSQCEGKVLLICREDATAIALERHLRLRAGVRSSVFHRHMSLLERDRAAAYFAGNQSASDGGSGKILVCSEIGSEGRNFQFCRHLVLFDLPLNPDVLEQRIGRLDRIGQLHDIQIHVPYCTGSPEEILFRWYHQGLNAFEQISPAAWRLWQNHQHELRDCLSQPQSAAERFEQLLADVSLQRLALVAELEQGRDQLLERNSFNAERAATLMAQIRHFDRELTPQAWLLNVLDSYSVFHEPVSEGGVTIVPGEDMLLPSFPGLPDEGFEACFDRSAALRREDRAYLNWQHPMVTGAIDLVLGAHQGRAAVSVLSDTAGIPEVHPPLLLECLYRVKVVAPRHLQLAQHLPETRIRLTIGLDKNEELTQLSFNSAGARTFLQFPDRGAAVRVLQDQQRLLLTMLESADRFANDQCLATIDAATKAMVSKQTTEIKRLLALRQRNPNIRQEEIDYLKNQTLELHQILGKAEAELVALHVILVP